MSIEQSKTAQPLSRSTIITILMMLIVLNLASTRAQRNAGYTLWIENSVQVNSTAEQAWKVLSDFAGTGSFHVLFDETVLLNGSPNRVAVGAERESLIPEGMFNLIQKERVVELVDGAYFTYEVYDSDKSALESMHITYGVVEDEAGKVRIYNRISLEEGSGVWKNFSRRKQNRDSQISLISYKHHIETGGSEKDIKRLKRWFASRKKSQPEPDMLATTDLEVN